MKTIHQTASRTDSNHQKNTAARRSNTLGTVKRYAFILALLLPLGLPATSARAVDCNGNGLEDSWELGLPVSIDGTRNSIDTYGSGTGGALTNLPPRLPNTIGNVTLRLSGQMSTFVGESLEVFVNGNSMGSVSVSGSFSFACSSFSNRTIAVAANTWNTAINKDSDATIVSVRRSALDLPVCGNQGTVTVNISYTPPRTAIDENGNNILDSCEGVDANGSGNADIFEDIQVRDTGQALGSGNSWGVDLADLDGDGDLDAFVANYDGPNKVYINQGGVQGATEGFFLDSGQNLGNALSFRVALGDVDGDTDVDAFVVNDQAANQLWLNDGNGNFTDSGQVPGTTDRSIDVKLADLDDDGDLDAFVVNHYNEPDQVWLNQGGIQGATEGVFLDSGQNLGAWDGYEVELGDVDGNGTLDAFVVNSNGEPSELYLNDGSANFTFNTTIGSYNATGVSLKDFDGDGDLDAYITTRISESDRVFINRGGIQGATEGLFVLRQSMPGSDNYSPAAADFDGDGDLDIFVPVNGAFPDRIYLNDGKGYFTDAWVLLGNESARHAAAGDLDGDGKPELFVAHNGSANAVYDFGEDANRNNRDDAFDRVAAPFDGSRLLVQPSGLPSPWVYVGAPDDAYYGLGNGTVIYELFGGLVVDGAGPDFSVYETDIGVDEFNLVSVSVSENGAEWINVSPVALVRIPGDSAHGNDSFGRSYDLSPTGLASARFIRLVGLEASAPGPSAGFDLDAIGLINTRAILADCDGDDIPDSEEPDCDGDGVPNDCDPVPAFARLYVKPQPGGLQDGSTWNNAIPLQKALCIARHSGGTVTEIWLQEGTYLPGDRPADSFELVDGVTLYGGFSGTETALSERNIGNNPTILSGDLLGNDTVDGGNRADNAQHVVTATGSNSSAVLDGVTVRGGNADGMVDAGIPGNTMLLRFDETTPTRLFEDESGWNNHARVYTASNPSATVAGYRGQGVEFGSGALPWIEVDQSHSVDFRNEGTVSFWIRPDSFPNTWSGLLYKGRGGPGNVTSRTYALWLHNTGYVLLTTSDGSSGNSIGTAAGTVVTGEWIHVAAVFNRAQQFMRIYLNGQLAASGSCASTPLLKSYLPLRIGAVQETSVSYSGFDGVMDEVALFDRVLTDQEIYGLVYNGGGGLHLAESNPTLRNLRVDDNDAGMGAGLYATGDSGFNRVPQLLNTIFTGNRASLAGGGIAAEYGLALINGAVAGNEAALAGGGIVLADEDAYESGLGYFKSNRESTREGNPANDETPPRPKAASDFTMSIRNSILWGNDSPDNGLNEGVVVPYPDAEGGISFPLVNHQRALYFEVEDATDITDVGTGDWTVEAWVKAPPFDARREIFSFGTNNPSEGSFFFINSNDRLQADLSFDTGPTSSTVVGDGQWHHVAVRHSAGTVSIFVDGALEGSDSMSPNITTGRALLGWAYHTETFGFLGTLREVRYWKTARSDQQIADNRFMALTGTETGLAGYWPLEALEDLGLGGDGGDGADDVRDKTAGGAHADARNALGGSETPGLREVNGAFDIAYSCVEGGWAGSNNIAADPEFLDLANGVVRLGPTSPCIDSANAGVLPGSLTADIDGLGRFFDYPLAPNVGAGSPNYLDMGPYEFQVELVTMGRPVTPPAGASGQPIDIVPSTAAWWQPTTDEVYGNDANQLVTITWPGPISETYAVIATTPTASLYVTTAPSNPFRVDLSPVVEGFPSAEAILHYNSVIQNATDAAVVDIGLEENLLVANKTGRVVLEYRNNEIGHPDNGRPIHIEVVEIRANQPVVYTDYRVGDQLFPAFVPDETCTHLIWRGDGVINPGAEYVYRQPFEGSTERNIYGIRPTTRQNDVEIYWRKAGFGNVCWMVEFSRYVLDWPSDPQLFVRRTGLNDPDNAEPEIDMTAHQQAQILTTIPNGQLEFASDRKARSTQPGWATVMYVDPDTLGNGQRVQFEVVRTVANNNGTYGFPLSVTRTIGAPIDDSGVTPDAALWLPFEEQPNAAAFTDESANGLIAECGNGNACVESGVRGRYGLGIELDGVDDHVRVLYDPALDPARLTITAWIRLTGLGKPQLVFGKRNGNNGYQYALEIQENGEIEFTLTVNGTEQTLRTTGFTVTPNQWTFVGATYDGSAMRVFRNEDQYGSPLGVTGSITGYTGPALIGRGYTSHLGGRVDEVALYPVALSPGKMETLAREAFDSAFVFSGNPYDPDLYNRDIFFDSAKRSDPSSLFLVNENILNDPVEAWYFRESVTRQGEPSGVWWPSKVVEYSGQWPLPPDHCITISNLQGAGPFLETSYAQKTIYDQPDRNLPGFNPNEEHGQWDVAGGSSQLYASRDDINSVSGFSKPYVLIRYQDRDEAGSPWEMDVVGVNRNAAEGTVPGCPCDVGPCDFVYSATAGTPLEPIAPLRFVQSCGDENTVDQGMLAWKDGWPVPTIWFRRGFGTATVRYHENWQGECAPWLDDGTGVPHPVDYPLAWPRYPASSLPVGAVKTKNYYNDVGFNQTQSVPARRAEILYNEAGASLIMPWKVSAVNLPLNFLPTNFDRIKDELRPDTRERLRYDVVGQLLIFEGKEDLNLIGIMTPEEKQEIEDAVDDLVFDPTVKSEFLAAIDALFAESNDNPVSAVGSVLHPPTTDWGLALSTGSAVQNGWVVLGYNGNYPRPDGSYSSDLPLLTSPPSDVEVYYVTCDLDAGDIQIIYPPCVFDEQVTLRWTGDCAGDCERFEFKWEWAVGDNPDRFDDIDPDASPNLQTNPVWNPYIDPDNPDTDGDGWVLGQNQVTVRGSNLLTLTDNWFHVKVRIPPDADPNDYACAPGTESPFTPATLKEGWLKRVKRGLNLFDQRISEFHKSPVAIYVAVMEQLGAPSEDPTPLSCNPAIINEAGLIDLYNTVLTRARTFTIDSPGYASYQPANQALLLIAGTLAEFYTLVGNEAFVDSTDPTVALRTDGSEGLVASSLFAFQGQFPWSPDSLLLEELALLRGRDNRDGTGIDTYPVYNRLPWNFILDTEAEVAYQQTYNIQDRFPYDPIAGTFGGDGIDEKDAQFMYPFGHGDAWGHYLTAMKYYYQMLRHPNFDWPVSSEYVKVGPVDVEVNFAHERKFARYAARRADVGRDIVNGTYRLLYSENPEEQWQGYPDPVNGRDWGVKDWGRRAHLGSYFDWVAANGIIPAEDTDPNRVGTVKQVDRTTVVQLKDIASAAREVQDIMDRADGGLNPLGLAKNVVPFDLKPQRDNPAFPINTHYEQIASRAQTVLANTRQLWDYANTATRLLRTHEETVQDFQNAVEDSETDYNNRLIEIFGYPYPEDINPDTGNIYGVDYVGPDLYHWMYIDANDLLGLISNDGVSAGPGLPQGREILVPLNRFQVGSEGEVTTSTTTISYNVVPGFGLMTPVEFKLNRRAPGEIQLARSDLLQAWWKFKQTQRRYADAVAAIEDQAADLEARHNLRSSEINIQRGNIAAQTTLSALIVAAQFRQSLMKAASDMAEDAGKDAAEALPRSVGFSNDVTAPARGTLRIIASKIGSALQTFADAEDVLIRTFENSKELADRGANLQVLINARDTELEIELRSLERSIRELSQIELELLSLQEEIRQTSGRYLATITRGERLLAERTAFRQVTAEDTTQYRYEDIAYRLFRNDALQKYRGQFDLAAQYVYLAVKAYGYETNLLDFDARSGEELLERVVRERVLGQVDDNGQPIGNSGLSGILRALNQNFATLKPLLGFNNPVLAANEFSLRRQMFRLAADSSGDAEWREQLRDAYVADLRSLPEFNQYFQHFRLPDDLTRESALVFEFSTKVEPDLNFFGWEGSSQGGDSFYLPTYFAIRIREAGVFFEGYDDSQAGLAETPAVYLAPIGSDVMRVPNVGQNIPPTRRVREWSVIDQILPVPNNLTAADFEQRGNGWLPTDFSQLGGNVPLQPLTRKHNLFSASHDGASDGDLDFIDNTFLVGRSVWNTRWMLIIPGRFLLQSDPDVGLERFIEGADGNGMVSDILMGFQTYQYTAPLGTAKPDAIKTLLARETAGNNGPWVESGAPKIHTIRKIEADEGELPEPPLVLFGRLENQAGHKVNQGNLQFDFSPTVGGSPVTVTSTLADLTPDYNFLAVVPQERGGAAAGDALRLEAGSYAPSVRYNGVPLASQLPGQLTPERGSVRGPLTYVVNATAPTPTATPVPTATPTPHPLGDLQPLMLDVNFDGRVDGKDLNIIINTDVEEKPLKYGNFSFEIDQRLFMLFAEQWQEPTR